MTHSSLDRCSATMPQRAVWGEVVGWHNDLYGDRRACRNARHVHDSGTWHLNLETLVGCLDRAHQDVRKSLTKRRHGTSGRSCSRWTCWLASSLARPCGRNQHCPRWNQGQRSPCQQTHTVIGIVIFFDRVLGHSKKCVPSQPTWRCAVDHKWRLQAFAS